MKSWRSVGKLLLAESRISRRGLTGKGNTSNEIEKNQKDYVSDLISGRRKRPKIFRTKNTDLDEKPFPVKEKSRTPKGLEALTIRQAMTNLLSNTLAMRIIEEIDEEDVNRSIELDFEDLKKEVTKSFEIVDVPESRIVRLLSKPGMLSLPANLSKLEVTFDFESAMKDYIQHVQYLHKLESRNTSDSQKYSTKNNMTVLEPINGSREYGISFLVELKHELGNTMSIHCVGGNYGLVIRQIINSSSTEISRCNRGSDLKFEIQKDLTSFLSSLAIDHNLAQFILAYSIEKEKNEYNLWLENMLSFLMV